MPRVHNPPRRIRNDYALLTAPRGSQPIVFTIPTSYRMPVGLGSTVTYTQKLDWRDEMHPLCTRCNISAACYGHVTAFLFDCSVSPSSSFSAYRCHLGCP